MFKRVKAYVSFLFLMICFIVFVAIGFVLSDYLSFEMLQYGYHYYDRRWNEYELNIAQNFKQNEYKKGNYDVFNWTLYEVEKKKEDGYVLYFYPAQAGGLSWKFFVFSLTGGLCCGQEVVLVNSEGLQLK